MAREPATSVPEVRPVRRGMIARLMGRALAGDDRGRLSILIYHRVIASGDRCNDWDPGAIEFDGQLRALLSVCTVLPLSEAIERLARGSLPSRAACITFDDGYRDNVEEALPILRRHGVPATFFIATGYLGNGRMWNDIVVESLRASTRAELDLRPLGLDVLALDTPHARRAAIERTLPRLKYLPQEEREDKAAAIANLAGVPPRHDLMMDEAGIRTLRAAGMEIGAHTVTHPILASTDPKTARHEITASRERLADLLREPIQLFAYPNGKPGQDYGPDHVRMVRDAGFTAAVSTAPGVASRDTDRFQLPRFTPWDRTPSKFALRILLSRRNARPASVPAA